MGVRNLLRIQIVSVSCEFGKAIVGRGVLVGLKSGSCVSMGCSCVDFIKSDCATTSNGAAAEV